MRTNIVQLILTAALVGITAWYAWTTYRLARAAKVQNDAIQTQLFDSFFLALLSFQDRVRRAQRLLHGQFDRKGQEAFDVAAEFLVAGYLALNPQPSADTEAIEAIDRLYHQLCQTPTSDFGRYFRHLYQVFRFLNDADIPNRRRYAALLRANLSTSELTLLFFNCLSRLGREKFKPLVERYAVFEDLRDTQGFLARLRHLYSPDAFGTGV